MAAASSARLSSKAALAICVQWPEKSAFGAFIHCRHYVSRRYPIMAAATTSNIGETLRAKLRIPNLWGSIEGTRSWPVSCAGNFLNARMGHPGSGEDWLQVAH